MAKAATKTTKEKPCKQLSERILKTQKSVALLSAQNVKTAYSTELATTVCNLIAAGHSMRKISKMIDVSVSNFFEWMRVHPDFAEQYTRATAERTHAFVEEILEIADEKPEYIVDEKGIKRVDSGHVQVRTQRIEARKWLASKMLPKNYGDKLQHTGDADNPIQSKITIEIVGAGQGSATNTLIDSSAKDITPAISNT